jgi:S1-C subfamily serine protease
MNRQTLRIALIAALASGAATLFLLRWTWWPGGGPIETPEPPALVRASENGAEEAEISLSPDEQVNVRVYARVSPGVVNITSTVVEYDFFFSPYAREGTGSGCILDKEGHILTNFHVIADAQNLEVSLPDHTKYRAKIVGTDKQNDLAVIQLVGAPPARLVPIEFGDSSRLRVGQKVLAIGNPFRLQNTLTVGIVSSLGRTIQTQSGYLVDNVIQTDAAINPGNSGGPLLNTLGEMVGINTSIFTTSGGNIGIGFAVPSNTVRRIVPDLIKEGRVLRPWLGIEGYAITDDLAEALELPVKQGILVAKVFRGSSADNAGIRGANQIAIFYNERILAGGDVITEVDGRKVGSMEDLRLALENKRPGDTAQITMYRGRTLSRKQVLLAEQARARRF